MISKNYFLVFILTFFVAGFFFLVTPDKAISGDPLGCCRNTTGQGHTCEGCPSGCQQLESDCTGGNKVFTADAICVLTNGSQSAECISVIDGCCQMAAQPTVGLGMCFQTNDLACEGAGFSFLGAGDCLPQFMNFCTPPSPTGCCETGGPMCTPDVTFEECETLSGSFTLGADCDGDFCGEAPPPIDGCCQFEPNDFECVDTTDVTCANEGGTFFPGGMCIFGEPDSFCELPTQGCCVIEPGVCEITTEGVCEAEGGAYQGDGSFCEGNPECVAPIAPIPTIGEWGMIAMAGLLGIFSLFIIMRRNRYNIR